VTLPATGRSRAPLERPPAASPAPGRPGAHGSGALGSGARDSRAPWRWLLGLTLLAALLRAIGLDQGLWFDEIYSLVHSVRLPLSDWLTVYRSDNQHPLYALLAHLSVGAFGEHPWSLRLPAALFGVASVPMLYLLGALVTSRREALLSALLLAVSYHHVWFSQNARGYSALAFWTLLATYLLIRGFREERWRPYLGYAAAAALAVYTHVTMVFMVASHALVCAWLLIVGDERGARLRDWRPPAAGFALAGALTLLLYAPILMQMLDFFVNQPSRLEGVSTPRWAFWEALRGLRIGLGGAAGVAVAGLLGGCGVWSYFKQSRLILALFLLPGLVISAGAVAGRGTMYPRFFFFLIGFGVLVLVRGAMVLSRWAAAHRGSLAAGPERGEALGTALSGLVIVLSAISLVPNYRYPKQDFEGAMRFVEAQKVEGEPVVTAGIPTTLPYRLFYGRQWESAETLEELRAVQARGRRTWLLYSFPRYIEKGSPELMAAIRREFGAVKTFRGTLGGGEIVVSRAEPRARPASR
jgi:mannosyltransferase